MPKGVYLRRPHMLTYGRGPEWRDLVREARRTASIGEVARAYGTSRATVVKLSTGQGWNKGRVRTK